MKQVTIKKQIITYDESHTIEFFENNQKLCLFDRSLGVSETILFNLEIESYFRDTKLQLKITWVKYQSDGQIFKNNFSCWLDDFMNEEVKFESNDIRWISNSILNYLNSERELKYYFILDTKFIQEQIDESVFAAKNLYDKSFNLDCNLPLLAIYNHQKSKEFADEYAKHHLEYSKSELFTKLYPTYKIFDIESIKELIAKLLENRNFKYILELDNTVRLLESEEYELTIEDQLMLNEIK